MKYLGYIIEKNEFSMKGMLKYGYWHEDNTDGDMFHCETVLECVQEIDDERDLFSCCGDILDRDSMICPTCKEHC